MATRTAPYDETGAMGGLFAPAFIFGDPVSEAAVARWNAAHLRKPPSPDVYSPPNKDPLDPLAQRDAIVAQLLRSASPYGTDAGGLGGPNAIGGDIATTPAVPSSSFGPNPSSPNPVERSAADEPSPAPAPQLDSPAPQVATATPAGSGQPGRGGGDTPAAAPIPGTVANPDTTHGPLGNELSPAAPPSAPPAPAAPPAPPGPQQAQNDPPVFDQNTVNPMDPYPGNPLTQGPEQPAKGGVVDSNPAAVTAPQPGVTPAAPHTTSDPFSTPLGLSLGKGLGALSSEFGNPVNSFGKEGQGSPPGTDVVAGIDFSSFGSGHGNDPGGATIGGGPAGGNTGAIGAAMGDAATGGSGFGFGGGGNVGGGMGGGYGGNSAAVDAAVAAQGSGVDLGATAPGGFGSVGGGTGGGAFGGADIGGVGSGDAPY